LYLQISVWQFTLFLPTQSKTKYISSVGKHACSFVGTNIHIYRIYIEFTIVSISKGFLGMLTSSDYVKTVVLLLIHRSQWKSKVCNL